MVFWLLQLSVQSEQMVGHKKQNKNKIFKYDWHKAEQEEINTYNKKYSAKGS